MLEITEHDILANVRIMAASPARDNWIEFRILIAGNLTSENTVTRVAAQRWQRAIDQIA